MPWDGQSKRNTDPKASDRKIITGFIFFSEQKCLCDFRHNNIAYHSRTNYLASSFKAQFIYKGHLGVSIYVNQQLIRKLWIEVWPYIHNATFSVVSQEFLGNMCRVSLNRCIIWVKNKNNIRYPLISISTY